MVRSIIPEHHGRFVRHGFDLERVGADPRVFRRSRGLGNSIFNIHRYLTNNYGRCSQYVSHDNGSTYSWMILGEVGLLIAG